MNSIEKQRIVEELKAKIAAIAPTLGRPQAPIPTGLSELDAEIKGWPVPGLTEISGPSGSGRIKLCLPSIARLSQQHRIGIVDPLCQIYPPGWTGLRLENLLLVRPPLERSTWSAEQLARSGCFALVGLLDPPRLGRSAARLTLACEQGSCALLVWTTEGDVRTPAKLRIQIVNRKNDRLHIRLAKERKELWL